MPYFAMFLEDEKRILKEVEDKIRRNQLVEIVVQMLLNRSICFISHVDRLNQLLDQIKKSQETMNKKKKMEEMSESLKFVQESMSKKIKDLGIH